MTSVFVNNIAVPRIARNKRVYGGNFATSAGAAAGGSDFVLDWAVVTEALVTINRDLHVTGNITASEEVVAWVAGAVESDVLANLTATAPLRKSTNSNIVLDYDTSQFEVVGGDLKIRDDFAGGGSVTSVGLSAPTGFAVTGSPVTGAGTLALSFASGYSLPTTVKQGQWNTAYSYSQVGHIPLSQKGAVNGVAELDGSGKVLSAQLPSYVDDVLDWATVTENLVTINRDLHVTGNITASEEVVAWVAGAVEYDVLASLTATAPLRKSTNSNIVLDYDTSQFEVVGGNLKIRDDFAGGGSVTALGETSSTAYRGDRGKIAYDHSQIVTGNPHQIGIDDLTDGGNVAKLDGINPFTADIVNPIEIFRGSLAAGYRRYYVGASTNGFTIRPREDNGDQIGTGIEISRDSLKWEGSDISTFANSGAGSLSLANDHTTNNLGNIARTGFYRTADNSVGQVEATGGSLIHITRVGGTNMWQLYNQYNNDELWFRRFRSSEGGWQSWYKLWNSGNSNLSTVDWVAKKLTAAAEISTNSKYELRNGTGVLKWSFELSGDDLIVKNSAGTIRGKITQAGDLAVEGEVTAFAVL